MIKIGKIIKVKFRRKDKTDYLVVVHFEFRGFSPTARLVGFSSKYNEILEEGYGQN